MKGGYMKRLREDCENITAFLLHLLDAGDVLGARHKAIEIRDRLEAELDVCGKCGSTYVIERGECCPEPLSRDDWEEEGDRMRLEERAQNSDGPFGLPHLRRF